MAATADCVPRCPGRRSACCRGRRRAADRPRPAHAAGRGAAADAVAAGAGGGPPYHAVVRRRGRRPLLDPRRRALRQRAPVHVAPSLRAALSAARHDDHARSELRRRSAAGGAVPERGLSRRSRPPRPGDCVAREGPGPRPHALAVRPRHRLRPLLVAQGLPRRRVALRTGEPAAGRAELAEGPGRHHAPDQRRPRGRPHTVA